ncbi:hypothetical protein [Pontibacter aquaedesilientis]|uniref:hypothetical protein n=1 Tax=Pontibacter aquaedesilientis TaxID=2766980 RepID=UPI00174753E6|nr:hypothetical protein [Pontibacter aquaedesilientis]
MARILMEEVLQINKKYQLRSISNGVRVLAGYLMVFAFLWIKGSNVLSELGFYLFMLGGCLVSFLPAFYLHIAYYIANRRTIVEVDKEKQLITVTDKKGIHVIHASDVKQMIRVVQRDYRLPDWEQNWIPLPWRRYGYLKLVTHDNAVFLLTSLMLDPVNPPIKETETQYKFLPDLNETVEEELTQTEIESQIRQEVESFKQKFKNYSEQELVERISKKGYRKEAVMAAEELLKENYNCQQELKHT